MRSTTVALTALLVGLSAPAFADATDGQDTFGTKCAICHNVDPGGASGAGPNLYGVVGSKAGTKPGFAYSDAMKNSGLTWDAATLTKYLANPGTVVPGNKMVAGFSGTTDDIAADLTAYLATLNGAAPAAGATTPPAGGTAPAPETPAPATPAPADQVAPATPAAPQ